MNAIQFFNFGQSSSNDILLCQVRLKNFFAIRLEQKIEYYSPDNISFSAILLNNITPSWVKTKNFDFIKESDDLLLKLYFPKKDLSLFESKKLSILALECISKVALPFFVFGNSQYINGKQLKPLGSCFRQFSTSNIFGSFFLEYKDGSELKFHDFLGKEVLISDEYN